ncbi:DUF4468 domain-containing protein [Adhaeribacter rhizoryzae]|uniref:DUF4468 domain-containing protein n=1 Tax=Adhaeribacter rhizoryzae TaxID=2607907 RepID=A0A5M6D8X2_9BACT|nr:DUF4468 domain-containing protein [Adhaeribacter rhizoryzae]KAA5542369.1 DUF4468 domain-containing protein [Adhaeribacter rhizoryzae]
MLVKILSLFFLLMPFHASAQVFPVDALSGKIYYAEEVLVKDGPQFDLYNRAKAWFSSSVQNKKALQVDDLANGLIIGASYRVLLVREGHQAQKFRLWFTVKIEMEDDHYWYSITDFQLQEIQSTKEAGTKELKAAKVPLEELVLAKNEVALKGEKVIFHKSLESSAYDSIVALIKDFKKSML